MKKYIPNIIMLIRAMLIIPIVISFIYGKEILTAILFIIAASSDFFDGFLARKWDVCSDFGRKYDPLIDKCLSLTVLTIIAFSHFTNIFLIATEFIIVIVGRLRYNNYKDLKVSILGKIKTVFLFFYVALVLLGLFNIYFFYFILALDIMVIINYLFIYKKELKLYSKKDN